MSESHIGGFRLPVQKLADTLIFAVPRKAKMQASPPLSTSKKASFVKRQKTLFCMMCSAGAERDVHSARDGSYERDVRSVREKELITLSQSRNPSRLVRRTASFPQQALRCLARLQGPGPVIFCQNVRANVGKGFDIFLTLR